MTEASLQDRLRGHAEAFNGLLSLIPAKQYYGEDTSDQWKKKKQTKKEAAAARRGKLDPDSELNRNAKEVMDERARAKRKMRQEEEGEAKGEEEDEDEGSEGENDDEDSFVPMDGVEIEQPGQGLKKAVEKPKKQKIEPEQDEESGVEVDDDKESAPAAAETKLSKKEQKKAAKRERKVERRAAKGQETTEEPTPRAKSSKDQEPTETCNKKKQKSKTESKAAAKAAEAENEDEGMPDAEEPSGCATTIDISGLEGKDDSEAVSEPHSPTFDVAEPASATTSVSSTIPPSEKPKHIVMPKDTSALKARLAAKIEALRAARKADGPDGKPIRTRQELIEARRIKGAQRKEHKKELRRLAKLEEERKREEALATNSPGLMSPVVEMDEGSSFSFGRVAFADGSQMSHDLSYVLSQGKKKGPSDAKTALIKVQNQKKRLADMDEAARADIADKDAWLTARRRVEGDKIRDDEAILKKTIKRKEAVKKRSEKAWNERLKGVNQSIRERVKKREDNLRKRRDDKLTGKAGKKKKGGGAGGKKKGGRPGFEGSFGVGGRKK